MLERPELRWLFGAIVAVCHRRPARLGPQRPRRRRPGPRSTAEYRVVTDEDSVPPQGTTVITGADTVPPTT